MSAKRAHSYAQVGGGKCGHSKFCEDAEDAGVVPAARGGADWGLSAGAGGGLLGWWECSGGYAADLAGGCNVGAVGFDATVYCDGYKYY